MSEKIPTAGKIWLWILLVLQVFNAISSLTLIQDNSMMISLAIISAVEAILLFLLLKGKGLPVFILYIVCHLANAGLSLYLQYDSEKMMLAAYIVGAIIGLAINFVPTYFSVKNTFQEKAQ